MRRVPIYIHVLNFLLKYFLFQLIFFTFQLFHFISIPILFLLLLPLLFTLIGVVADWVIVPKLHNIVSSMMGSIFMGSTTYMIPLFIADGHVPLLSAIFLAFSLGIVELSLHRLIVKPYLDKS